MARWPDGFVCPECGSARHWRLTNGRFQCQECRHQTSPTAGCVEVDDAYVGGEHHEGKRVGGAAGKMPFVVAVRTPAMPQPLLKLAWPGKTT